MRREHKLDREAPPGLLLGPQVVEVDRHVGFVVVTARKAQEAPLQTDKGELWQLDPAHRVLDQAKVVDGNLGKACLVDLGVPLDKLFLDLCQRRLGQY